MTLRRISALTIGFILSAALSSSVLAADIESPAAYDWTGFYVGGQVGYGWTKLNGRYDYDGDPGDDFVDDDQGAFDLKDDNFLAGIQAGYNWQIDSFVLGVEGDVAYINWADSLENSDDERVSFDTNFLATVRARVGFAADNVLIFATAGAGWTDTNYEANDDFDDPDPDEVGDINLDDVGFVFGGGAEYALSENWSVKAEALYFLFGGREETEQLTDDSQEGDFIELEDIFVLRTGLNFHF